MLPNLLVTAKSLWAISASMAGLQVSQTILRTSSLPVLHFATAQCTPLVYLQVTAPSNFCIDEQAIDERNEQNEALSLSTRFFEQVQEQEQEQEPEQAQVQQEQEIDDDDIPRRRFQRRRKPSMSGSHPNITAPRPLIEHKKENKKDQGQDQKNHPARAQAALLLLIDSLAQSGLIHGDGISASPAQCTPPLSTTAPSSTTSLVRRPAMRKSPRLGSSSPLSIRSFSRKFAPLELDHAPNACMGPRSPILPSSFWFSDRSALSARIFAKRPHNAPHPSSVKRPVYERRPDQPITSRSYHFF